MRSRDSQKKPEAEHAEAAEAEASQHVDGLDDSALQTPEVPDISIFDSLDDDGVWYEDGDPTQEVEDNDIVEEEFVLVGEDGAPIPATDDDPAAAEADLPAAPQLLDLPPAPRVAKLPAPGAGKAEALADALAMTAPVEPDPQKAKSKGKGKGKAKAKAKGKAKAKAKTKAKTKAKAPEQEKPEGKAKPEIKSKPKAKSKAKPEVKAKTKPAAKAEPAVKDKPASDGQSSHLELGLALREQGQPQRALEELIKALPQGSRAVDCHTSMGLCYMDMGIASKAISSFKNALFAEDVSDAESTTLYYELGRAQERQEEWDEALYYYRRVIKADPELRDTAARIEKIEQLQAKQPS